MMRWAAGPAHHIRHSTDHSDMLAAVSTQQIVTALDPRHRTMIGTEQ